MSNTSRSTNAVRTFISLVMSALIVAAAVWVFLNRQYALDTVTNWTYEPSTIIKDITARTELTDKGKFTFYATKPDILERQQFNESCPRQEPGSPILGCYTTDDRIYVFNVTDEKLDGIKEVTAAHEVLHAAWQRTSTEERERLSKLLQTAYEKNTDSTLKTRMDYYERTEPGEFINELHSILGTETANLSDELESYYSQYFNRETVLALHDNYSLLYTGLNDKAVTLYAEMNALSAAIDKASEAYVAATKRLSAEVDAFNQRADSGSFDSTAQFNSERAALLAMSQQLEVDRQAINTSIATYNGYYTDYQKLAEQLEYLNQSMDSYRNLEEAPSV